MQGDIQSSNFWTFMEPRNRFQGINSASLCSPAGRYDNPIPTRFLAPIECLKIPAQVKYSIIMSQIGKGKGGGVRPVFIHFSGLIISPLMYAWCVQSKFWLWRNMSDGIHDSTCFTGKQILCILRVIACIFYSRREVVFFGLRIVIFSLFSGQDYW